MIQEGSSVSAPSCSSAVDCMSNIGAVIFNELPVSDTELLFSYPSVLVVAVVCPCSSLSFFFKVHKRILCITLLLGLSNDEDSNVKVKRFTELNHCYSLSWLSCLSSLPVELEFGVFNFVEGRKLENPQKTSQPTYGAGARFSKDPVT